LKLTLKNSNKKSFGASAPASDLFNHFEINSKKVVEEILALIS
jgi:transketolase